MHRWKTASVSKVPAAARFSTGQRAPSCCTLHSSYGNSVPFTVDRIKSALSRSFQVFSGLDALATTGSSEKLRVEIENKFREGDWPERLVTFGFLPRSRYE